MDKPLLSYSLWLQLDSEQKRKMVKLFGIPRTGEVVVHVGEMMNGNIGASAKQDGHRPENFYAITSERMVELLNLEVEEGATHNFYELYQTVIDNLDAIYYEQHPAEEPHVMIVTETIGPGVIEPGAVVPVTTEEFVPRDPEELIKKSEVGDAVSSMEGAVIAVPEAHKEIAEEIVIPKKDKDAKTTKAKGSKAK